MASGHVTIDLVGLIYDAAGDSTRWPAFLKQLRTATHSAVGSFFIFDPRHNQGGIGATVGVDRAWLRSYERYYRARNISLIRGKRRLAPGSVCRSELLCPDREARRTELYNDFVRPQKLSSTGLNAVIVCDRSVESMVGVIRHAGAEPYGDADIALVRSLLPHLQRAVQLHQRIARLEAESQAGADVLDRWALGVVLLDSRGRVVLMNRSAEEILKQNDGLSLDAGGLSAAQANKTAALRSLVRSAIQTTLDGNGDPGGALTLPRPSLKRALNILVTPVCFNKSTFPESGVAAAVFVSDPEASVASSKDLLRQLYGLSHAEAILASRLLEGKDLKRVSEERAVSLATTRTHLRNVFEKTGTKRQAELVQLLLRSPASLRPETLIKNHPFE